MKKYFLIVLIGLAFLSFPSIISNVSGHETEGLSLPVVDVVDLKVDGSGQGGVNVSLTSHFDVITRLIVHVEFVTIAYSSDEWGSGPALENGTLLLANIGGTIVILNEDNPIQRNGDWGQLGYDLSLLSDDRNPKGRLILSRVTFTKFNPFGIDNRTGLIYDIFFQVRDDLTNGSTTEFTVAMEGCINCYKDQTVNIGHTVTVIDPTTIYTATTGVLALPTDLDYFEERTNPYFWTGPDFILLKGLTINTDYSLLIASNFDINDRHWLNFTATQNTIQIKFLQDSDVFDQHKPILEMKLYLTQNNQLLETTWMPIVYPEDQFSGDFLTQLIGSGAIIIVIVAFFVGFVAFFFGRKRR